MNTDGIFAKYEAASTCMCLWWKMQCGDKAATQPWSKAEMRHVESMETLSPQFCKTFPLRDKSWPLTPDDFQRHILYFCVIMTNPDSNTGACGNTGSKPDCKPWWDQCRKLPQCEIPGSLHSSSLPIPAATPIQCAEHIPAVIIARTLWSCMRHARLHSFRIKQAKKA